MGIQLDWQVESNRARQSATEDPKAKYDRRRRRRRVIIGMIVVAVLFGGIITAVRWRLSQVDNRLRNDLVDTVNVEMTALRVGNRSNFLSVQRSASEEWLAGQHQLFEDYQSFKAEGILNTEYEVLNVFMDDDQPRARVVVQQEIDGIPYRMAWFYWRYADPEGNQNGWRHVPPDVEFWGEKDTIQKDNFRLTYHDLDADLAEALAPMMADWWNEGCELLGCEGDRPTLEVTIVPESLEAPMWDLYDPFLLRIPSPLIQPRAPYDAMPPTNLQAILQEMVVRRLLDTRVGVTLQPSPYTDTYWLAEEITLWLKSQFNGEGNTGSAFISSLATNFGEDFPARMMRSFGLNSNVGFLEGTFGVPLPDLSDEQLNAIAWSEFFHWRLRAEQVAQGADPNAFREFYDTSDGDALLLAQQRYEKRDPNSPIPRVLGVVIGRDTLGRRIASVNVLPSPDDPNTQVTLVFRWVGTTWKRIS